MPSIMAVPYPTRGHVLIEVNFADVSGATHVCVEAVTGSGTSSEVRRQLHPYVSYNSSGCLALSCGQAIFWDTEISCGTPTIYCATAFNAAGEVITQPADALVTDTFTRVVAAGWGSTDTGQAWTNTGGAAADHSVTGTRGQMATVTIATNYLASIPMTTPNADAMVSAFPAAIALTQSTQMELWLRGDGTALNGYRVVAIMQVSGLVDIQLQRVVAGVATTLATLGSVLTYTAATMLGIRLQAWGNQLNAMVWDNTGPMPTAFQLTATDTTFTAPGTLNLLARRNAGNTNGTINMQWDNLTVTDVCAEPVDVTSCTTAVTIACDGCFRLGNPVRPCDDVRICLCADGVDCGGTGGLFFVSMTPDTRTDNSGQMVPVNDAYPIPTSRRRMKPTSTLTVSATSFVARNELIELLDPGEPLLLRTTPEFGIGDRYLQIGDVPETYGLSDMTVQPRLLQMPNAEVRGPVGPSLGVCGARVIDLCDIYATWDAVVAAGLTYADLLRGEASPPGSGLATWTDINAQNASWAILLVNEPDWNDVLDGD